MLAIERRRKIINIIEEKNSVMVLDLSKVFNVTEETVRRDLEKLEKEGLLKRTYGGAIINDSTNADLPINIREGTNIEGKEAIGKKVAEYIKDGETILLDSSTTTLQVAKYLKNKRKITVITNSVPVLKELAGALECNTISTGGNLRGSSMSLVGHMAEDTIEKYNVDKALICCKGVDIQKGITESNELEAEIKKKMGKSSYKRYLLADYTKFNKISFVKMFDFVDIDIIFTDKKLSSEWEQFIKSKEIQLIYCE